ncbi:hypothetical protein [Streptomyces sp. NPDC058086]|uniref:hypothetical protein n=1 Tax=Streptomyces sp. NPDC058086 TaxID=3346334 RepID=UPI0036E3116E
MSTRVAHALTSVDELRDKAELVDIVYYEVSGRRLDGFTSGSTVCRDDVTPDDDTAEIELMQRLEGDTIYIRLRALVITAQGRLIADVAAVFRTPERVSVSPPVISQFADIIATPVVRPYLREAIHQTAVRLGIDAPLLSILDTRERTYWHMKPGNAAT